MKQYKETKLTTATLEKGDRIFLRRLKADLKMAALKLERSEARYLVDLYYQLQNSRKTAKQQSTGEEPNELLAWIGKEYKALEDTVKQVMGTYAEKYKVGRWSQSITGVGPVISAGLIAHIDIEKAKTAGSIWRFAGLDPTVTWKKKTKRPWNAKLKTLCWKFADCQVKFQNHENSFYGPLYRQYKDKLIIRNEAGEFADAAAEGAERVGNTTEAYGYYKRGILSPGHIESRAKRWVAKVFISHWHTVAWREHFGTEPPKPYVLAHMDHTHMIEVPNQ